MLRLSGIPWELRPAVQQFKRQVHDELLKRMNLRNMSLSGANASEVVRQAGDTIRAILTEHRQRIPSGINVELMETELLHEAVSLGPLDPLLKITEITEIMVNGAQRIYVEKKGRLYRTDMMFADDSQLLTIIERIVAPLGRRIDESQPMVDARLSDGSRVNAIIPPLSLEGPILTIRKFAKEVLGVEALIGFGSLTKEMADFLRLCVLVRKNILISGGTGSGKTTLLNIMSNFLPNEERIITVEDAAELRLAKEHVIRLESRPQNIEGRGEIAIRDLVRNALRMRPDRIVVGECRGGEALDMLQAMNTGHDGSLTTIHANTARDALARLETLVLMAGFDLPLRAIREQVASAITIIVQISRCKDGSRKVMDITEVTGMEGEVITTQEIFRFVQEGINEDGSVRGKHVACGIVPTFMQELQEAGIAFNLGMFNEN
jgi:pilus assembly protein CpaF